MKNFTKKDYLIRRLKNQKDGVRQHVENYLDINVTYSIQDLLRYVKELEVIEKMVKDET